MREDGLSVEEESVEWGMGVFDAELIFVLTAQSRGLQVVIFVVNMLLWFIWIYLISVFYDKEELSRNKEQWIQSNVELRGYDFTT